MVVLLAFAAACSSGSTQATPASGPPPATDPVVISTQPLPPPPTKPPQPRYVTGASDYLFDQTKLHTFEITVDTPKLAILNEDPAAEEYVEASLAFEGESVGPVGLRYKGSVGAFIGCTDGPNPLAPSGLKTCDKLSMKIKIDWTDPDALFYGVSKVQLHSMNLDPSLMRDRLGYWLFREMGVPTPGQRTPA